MSDCHEFGIIHNFSEKKYRQYSRYEPERFELIDVSDYDIGLLWDKIEEIKMYNPAIGEECYGLCSYGITIIPVTALENFRKAIISANDIRFGELLTLTERAIEENCPILHYGI